VGEAALLFGLALLAAVAGFIALRKAVATLIGARGGWLTVGLVCDARRLNARRIAIAAAGVAGCYFVAGSLIAAGMLIAGRVEIDETSMRVQVAPDMPAASAGFRDGDRVVSVNGEPCGSWDALKREVAAHAGEMIDVEVERDGARHVLEPTVGSAGKIGVGPYARTVAAGLGDALRALLLQPGVIVADQMVAIGRTLRGKEKVEASGPIGVTRMQRTANGAGLGAGLEFAGSVDAACLWIALLFSICLSPWPIRPRRAV
jgi:regulator of sigma E protease